ncbi:WD repeat-containing protein 74-like [Macrosteles quadrilineatus]|uniref:WD repeat-containing protein 74-like n=1 Tax=Macrosteles quadrilineatus TaxID=74068 RepID=UPI0023E0CFA9|nr:WD repeat-containing protein 74-like [Macrosteles quadrilineatus]
MEDYHNVFIGGVSGVFKGLKASHNKGVHNVKNLQKLKEITQRNEVTFLNWADKLENEILIGYSNQLVKIFDLTSNTFILNEHKTIGEGPIRGIFKVNSSLVTAVESGIVKVWGETDSLVETGGPISRMRHSPNEDNVFATGGKENDLKLWDVETGKNTFTAKNVRHDWLELRVPVWVMDLAFVPESKQVAVATRYGHVRLYDPSTPTRRPVCQVEEKDVSFTCIAPAPRPNHVVVGCAAGNMYLVDLRGKGLLLNKFRGFMGGVRAVACPTVEPYVLSVSLDRHFRIHHLNTKKLLFKEYMQSRLSALLIKSSFTMEDIKEEAPEIKEEDAEAFEADEEYEQMFNEMEVITDKVEPVIKKTKKGKKKVKENNAIDSIIEDEIKEKLTSLHKDEILEQENPTSKRSKSGKVKSKKLKRLKEEDDVIVLE